MDPSEVPENVAAAMPKAHKDLIDPPENTVVQFFGSRDLYVSASFVNGGLFSKTIL